MKKFGLLAFQMRLKRNLPRRSFWGIVLVTLLCLPLSRVRKEYLLQRRFFLQPTQPACCPKETILNGPLFQLSPYADLLSGKASAASDPPLWIILLSQFWLFQRNVQTAYCSPGPICKSRIFLREEETTVITQAVIQPDVLYCTSHSQWSRCLN